MKPYYERSGLTLHLGDCLEVMASLPENSIDTCITDPPYELGFMGKKWDASGVAFQSGTWVEVLRILKPGSILMAFGGTRTHHRLMCAIEDAGFEIRDCMMWLYGSGFPKSLDISKAIDKAAGEERQVIGPNPLAKQQTGQARTVALAGDRKPNLFLTSPATDSAKEWDGYGTALKPAWEPIIVAMKPLDGTFAENAQKWGVAGLAIDAGRIQMANDSDRLEAEQKNRHADFGTGPRVNHIFGKDTRPVSENGNWSGAKGRWPANLLLDEEAAAMLDEQSGVRKSGVLAKEHHRSEQRGVYGKYNGYESTQDFGGDSGGASRFFYVAKASRSERDAGLENMPKRDISFMNTHNGDADKGETWSPVDERTGKERDRFAAKVRNHHPTVKPVALMEYLCTLTRTPTGGIVLDPFMGSGTTGIGAIKTGRPFVGIERDAQYIEIAYNRLNGIQSGMLL